MTQDEIIEMAKQAGAASGKPTPDAPEIVFTQCLDMYLFAKLVEDAAFKRWAAQTKLAVETEREACAQICDSVNSYDNPMTANDVADAIRARGQE